MAEVNVQFLSRVASNLCSSRASMAASRSIKNQRSLDAQFRGLHFLKTCLVDERFEVVW